MGYAQGVIAIYLIGRTPRPAVAPPCGVMIWGPPGIAAEVALAGS
jgi:hypothetical protein